MWNFYLQSQVWTDQNWGEHDNCLSGRLMIKESTGHWVFIHLENVGRVARGRKWSKFILQRVEITLFLLCLIWACLASMNTFAMSMEEIFDFGPWLKQHTSSSCIGNEKTKLFHCVFKWDCDWILITSIAIGPQNFCILISTRLSETQTKSGGAKPSQTSLSSQFQCLTFFPHVVQKLFMGYQHEKTVPLVLANLCKCLVSKLARSRWKNNRSDKKPFGHDNRFSFAPFERNIEIVIQK